MPANRKTRLLPREFLGSVIIFRDSDVLLEMTRECKLIHEANKARFLQAT